MSAASGQVYLIYSDSNIAVGTVTVKQNEINRLFVLPGYQKRGYGKKLLEYAENMLAGQHYDTIVLDASLPAKAIYKKRGYAETESHSISTENGYSFSNT